MTPNSPTPSLSTIVAPLPRCGATLALWLALTITSSAGIIDGPMQVGVDKSAILKVPLDAAGTSYSWQVASDIAWVPGVNNEEAFVILLDLPPGPHVVSFVSFDRSLHELAVVHSGPSPGPNPPRPPSPNPDNRFGLARDVALWTQELDASHRADAVRLAQSFRAVASAIAAGTLRDPAAILAETRASNNRALASNQAIEAWKPFSRRLETRLSELHRDKQLVQADDYRQAWIEIAQGLEDSIKQDTNEKKGTSLRID